MDIEDYKSLLIVNDSDATVTLYVYAQWDPICWISKESKILYPVEKYLYRSKNGFQFELVARFEVKKDKEERQDSQYKKDKPPKKRQVLNVRQWKSDRLFKITSSSGSYSLGVAEENLAYYPQEKRLCLRKIQRDKELQSTGGGPNLYEILGLDMTKIRKMPKEEQKEAIKRGYHTQIRRWHPDNNGGDEGITKEIICAYEILKDEALRARYNNLADYGEGWLSWRRYKAIFNPECVTKEQKIAYRKRMCLFATSVLATAAGIGLTVYSAGLAAAALVAKGAVLGGGLTGGGLQSLQHTLNERAIVDECLVKEWLMKAGIGFVGGAVTEGAAAACSAAITGLGSAALESAAITRGQFMALGAATGAAGGVASSIASDAGRKFADGEQITWKQVVRHATCGAVVGAAAGVAAGAVTKGVVHGQTSAASANLKGEVAEQVFNATGARRLGNKLARNIPRKLIENGTEAVMNTVGQFAEERLDDSVNNRSPGEHVSNGFKNMVASGVMGSVVGCGAAVASHAWNERKVCRRFKNELFNAYIDGTIITGEAKHELRDKIRFDLGIENNEHRHKWLHGKSSAKYQPLNNENASPRLRTCTYDLPKADIRNHSKWPSGYRPLSQSEESSSSQSLASNLGNLEEATGKVKYLSKSTLLSKMVVTYFLNNKCIVEEVNDSGNSVDVPSGARHIKVEFKVKRLLWDSIWKYDRFKRCWCVPYEPHVFLYDSPPNRTFTIGGEMWREKVIKVSDEYYDETNEM